jgi:hypothetical protein
MIARAERQLIANHSKNYGKAFQSGDQFCTQLTRYDRANVSKECLPALSKTITNHNSNEISIIARIAFGPIDINFIRDERFVSLIHLRSGKAKTCKRFYPFIVHETHPETCASFPLTWRASMPDPRLRRSRTPMRSERRIPNSITTKTITLLQSLKWMENS